jgi:hypothetical protein
MFTTCKPLPSAVQEIYPTSVGDGLVLAGGIAAAASGGRAATDETWIYGPNGWRPGPPLGSPRHHPYLVTRQRSVLAIGGFKAGSLDVDDAWEMTDEVLEMPLPAMQAWLQGPRLPAARAEFSAGVVDGIVVIAGGRTPRQPGVNSRYEHHADTAGTLVLAPDASGWVGKRPMPTARNSAAAAVLKGRLHVIGGRQVKGDSDGRSENLAAHEAYDVARNEWEVLPGLPRPLAGAAAAVWGGHIYVFGGEQLDPPPDQAFLDIWRYAPATKIWSHAGTMPAARHGLGAVTLPDGIHLVGGATGPNLEGTCNCHDVFAP